MFTDTAAKPVTLTDTQRVARSTGSLISRKIWLPKILYAALPGFYVLSGVAALLATLYINRWFWVLPHYVLFAVACLHMGALVYRRRHRKERQ